MVNRKHSRLGFGILLAACVILQLPYLDQAFHIDDNIFLIIAENMRMDFWFPQDLSTYFEGLRVESFISHEHPLFLTSLLLTPALAFGNASPEIIAHLVYLFFYVLLVVSTYLLAREMTDMPLAAALLTAISPVVLVSSHTVMADVPFTALIYSALALVISGRGAWVNVVAGISCAAAVMFAYQAFFFVPLVYWAGQRESSRRSLIWIVPLAAVLGYGLINSLYFGRFIWWDLFWFWHQQPASAGGFGGRIVHSLLGLFGGVVFPMGWFFVKRLNGFRKPPLQLAKGASVFVGMIVVNILMILFVYHAATVRYWLPSVPVVCTFVANAVVQRAPRRQALFAMATLIVLTSFLSIVLANADHEWANFYRETAQVVPQYTRDGAKVWAAGEWGFRWYFTHHGAQLLGRADGRPKPGDVLIRPKLASPYLTLYDREPDALVLERTIDYRPSTPVRLLDFDSHAGFYSFGWGYLPYSLNFSNHPLEQLFIYRINKTARAPKHEPTYWEWNR